MKIRSGFVSNSSSSSFICCVCGEDYTGYDAGLSDADMFECENGHTCCNSHKVGGNKELSVKQMKEYLLDQYEGAKEEIDRINAATDEEIEVEYNDLGDETSYEVPECRCPVCQFKKPYSDTMLKYFLKKNNLTEKELMEQLRSEFSSWKEFLKYIK